MVRVFLFLCLLGTNALAGEGRVSVLEAPMFRRPSVKAKIVQYVQKGEIIYIHPQVLVDEKKYRQFRPDTETRERLEKELAQDPDLQDPYFDNDTPAYHDKLKFVLTKDNQGRDAWVLRKHVHVYYEDEREFTQLAPRPDPTDYRLTEPLPTDYPLYDHDKVRGWLQLGVGSAFSRNYPYKEKIIAESYGQQLELNAAILWQRGSDPLERTFLGALLSIRTSTSDYTLQTRTSKETWARFGIGPLITYDPFRQEKNLITLYAAPILYPYAQVSITQSNPAGTDDTRTYWAWGASGRFGAQYSRLKVTSVLDFVVGVWGEVEGPLSMRSKNTASVPAWWAENKGDNFSTGFTYTLAGQIGLQASY